MKRNVLFTLYSDVSTRSPLPKRQSQCPRSCARGMGDEIDDISTLSSTAKMAHRVHLPFKRHGGVSELREPPIIEINSAQKVDMDRSFDDPPIG